MTTLELITLVAIFILFFALLVFFSVAHPSPKCLKWHYDILQKFTCDKWSQQ